MGTLKVFHLAFSSMIAHFLLTKDMMKELLGSSFPILYLIAAEWLLDVSAVPNDTL